jgi:hypothetical protein
MGKVSGNNSIDGISYADVGSPKVIHNYFKQKNSFCVRESSSMVLKESVKSESKKAPLNQSFKLLHMCNCGAFDCTKAMFEK